MELSRRENQRGSEFFTKIPMTLGKPIQPHHPLMQPYALLFIIIIIIIYIQTCYLVRYWKLTLADNISAL